MSKTWIITLVVPALTTAALAQDGAPQPGPSPAADTALFPYPDDATQNFRYCDLARDGVLDMRDFIAFQQLLEAGDIRANCDGSTADPVLNVADLTCFIRVFGAAQLQTPWTTDLNMDGATDQSDFDMFRTLFEQRDPRANCDGSTVEPVVNAADLTCFLRQFADSTIGQVPADATAGLLKEAETALNQAKGTNLSGTTR